MSIEQRYNILIVEDNKQLAETVREFLGDKHYNFRIALNGTSGLKLALKNTYDLIMLDVMLPGIGGFEILRILRESHLDMPILMLTEKIEVENVENGFANGADAYLPKPFNYRELKARIDGLLKRPPKKREQILQIRDLKIYLDTNRVFRGEAEIFLRKKEYEILKYMMNNPGRLLTREQIMNNIWSDAGEPYYSTIDVHISNIRRKVLDTKDSPFIKTAHGMGFIFAPQGSTTQK